MKNTKSCQTTGCCWSHRHEVLGIVLLILGAILTVITFSGLGIAAMLLVGFAMCCHKHFGCCRSHCDGSQDDSTECSVETGDKPVGKKTARKAKA